MKSVSRNFVVGLMCAAGVSACGGSSSTNAVTVPSGPWGSVDATLNGFLSSSAGADRISGYSFEAVSAGSVLHTSSGGNQNQGSLLPIASASKLPSALAILTLVDLPSSDPRHINLDTPVSSYIGSGVTWPGDKAAITMRMLLNHTSGLPGLDHQSDAGFPACVNEDNPTAATDYTFVQCVQDVANTTLANPPGQVFDYGGADFQVAGYVAMVMAGKSTWQDFFNTAFAAPMGIDTNLFTYGDPSTVTNPRVAGGVTTDVDNYGLILRMLLNHGVAPNGTSILSSGTLANFRQNQIFGGPAQPAGATIKDFYPPNLTPAIDYPGYSFGLFFSAPSLYAPSIGPEFSDPGSYGTTPWIDLDSGSSATPGPAAYAAILLIDNGPATPVGIDIWNAVRPDVQTAVSGG